MESVNVIIGKGLLEGPDYYTDIFIKYLNNHSVDTYILDVTKTTELMSESFIDFSNRPNTVAFTFNNVLFRANGILGSDFWKNKKIPVFDYIVDHPRYYSDTMLDPVCDLYVFALDIDHVSFIKQHYPKVKGVFFSPNGGTEIDNSIPFADRQFDVIYMGNCKPAWILPKIDIFPPETDFFNGVLGYLMNDSSLPTETAIDRFLSDNNIIIDTDTRLELNTKYGQIIENVVRRYYMLEAMTALDNAGIEVHVFGNGWNDDDDYRFSDNIHFYGRIPLLELMEKIGLAKISLNFIPWFKNGCSEKNFDAMLNGCLCVSDRSGYLEERYTDGRNIVYFDLNNPAQMASDIQWLLNNPSQAESIAKKGYETAAKFDTWNNRFENVFNVIAETVFGNKHLPKGISQVKRLLCITPDFNKTGAPLALLGLLKLLIEKNYYDIYVLTYGNGPLKKHFESLIGKDHVKILNGLNPTSELRYKLQNDYDIVLLNTVAVYIFALYYQNTNTPVYWWIHEAPEMIDDSFPAFPNPHLLSPNFSLFTPSKGAAEWFNKRYLFNISVLPVPIYNSCTSVDDIPVQIPEDRIVFFIPGAYSYIKGQDILLSAISSLPENFKNVSLFVFCGYTLDKQIEYKKHIIEMAAEADNVLMLEDLPQKTVYALMQRSHCIVAPSRIDCLPTTIAEGLMFKKICLVSDHTGISYYINDCVNGFIFSNQDELVKRLLLIINDHMQISNISNKGYELYSAVFSPTAVATVLDNIGL